MISFQMNTEDFIGRISFLDRRVVRRAVVRSLNRTLDGVSTQVDRTVRSAVRLKRADVMKSLTKYRAKTSTDFAKLVISHKPVPLHRYLKSAGGKRKRGVKVNITGTTKVVRGGFIATTKSGHTGIFKRLGKKRLPIEELFSSSVRDVFRSQDRVKDIIEIASERYKREFNSSLDFYLGR